MKNLLKLSIVPIFLSITLLGFKSSVKLFYYNITSFIQIKNGIIYQADFNKSKNLIELHLDLRGNKKNEFELIGDNNAVKISLDRYSDECFYRSELTPINLNKCYFYDKNPKYGVEYWYYLNIFLPKDWEFTNVSKTLMQWHGKPDLELNEESRNPPLDFKVDSGSNGIGKNYFISHRADSKKITGHSGPYEINERTEIGSIEQDIEKWVGWAFHVKWSFENDGFIIVYKNGEEVYKRENEKNCYNDLRAPYWKFGIYIPSWKDNNFPQYGKNSFVAYFRNIIIGNKDFDITQIN